MAAIITSLPAEITNEILNVIDDPHTFLQLMQCSRYFHDFTLPRLYRNVELHMYAASGGSSGYTNNLYWRSYELACHLLGKGEVAALVRSVSTSWKIGKATCAKREFPTKPSRGIPCDLLDKNVVRAIDSLSDTEDKKDPWFAAFHDCCDAEAAIAIILPFLPNLQYLDIMCNQNMIPNCVEVLTPGPCESSFNALKKLAVRQERGRPLVFDRSLAQFFAIPSLLEVRLSSLQPYEDLFDTESNGPGVLEPSSSNVIDVSLWNTAMHPRNIGTITSGCHKLQTLRISWYHAYMFLGGSQDGRLSRYGIGRFSDSSRSGRPESDGTEMETLSEALQSISSTCETLSLQYLRAQRSCGNSYLKGQQNPLAPLSNFLQLKFLTLGMAFVFGVRPYLFGGNRAKSQIFLDAQKYKGDLPKFLPPRLESLTLIRHEPEDMTLLLMGVEAVLSAMKEGEFKSLKVIDVEDRKSKGRNPGRFSNDRWISQVEDRAGEVGVKFQLIVGEALD